MSVRADRRAFPAWSSSEAAVPGRDGADGVSDGDGAGAEPTGDHAGTEPGPDDVAVAPPRNRMAIALLALAGFFVAGYLLLSKLGLTGPLVCGIGDCGRVQASRWAVFLGVPVPAWGVLGYAVVFGVALAGLRPVGVGDRRIAAGLAVFAFVAFAFTAYLTALEAFVIRAWCQWCVVSAVIATLIFLLALVELPRLRSD